MKQEEVQLKMLLAYPQKYSNKLVKISEVLAIRTNDIRLKCFDAYQLGANAHASIKVSYGELSSVDQHIVLDPTGQKIMVQGLVAKTDVVGFHIIATEITFL